MSAPLSDPTLDAILALQITIAWAGEGRCTPKRLGWWDTDLVDEMGGGDLLRRLLPKTGAWAALEAVREAARRTDAKARAQMADADRLRTLFFLGFDVDEQLAAPLSMLGSASSPVVVGLNLRDPMGQRSLRRRRSKDLERRRQRPRQHPALPLLPSLAWLRR